MHQFFSRAAAQRLQEAPEGTTAYNLFGVSRGDLERLREQQRAYFREMRAIIADSQPVEDVVLANMQMIVLSSGRSTEA